MCAATIGRCPAAQLVRKPRWAGLGGAGQTLLRDHKVWMGLIVESVLCCVLSSRCPSFLRFSGLAFYLPQYWDGHHAVTSSVRGRRLALFSSHAGLRSLCSSGKRLCHLVWFQCRAFGRLAIEPWRLSVVAHLLKRGYRSNERRFF